MGKRIQKLMLKDLAKKTLYLGYASENIHTQIVIDCSEVFWDYPNATYSMNIQPPRGDKYPAAQLAKDGDALVWTVTDSDLIYHGSGHIQLEFKNGDEVIKSAVGTTKIDGSIETTGDVPTPLEDWMDQAEETAHQIALTAKDEVIEQIQDAAEEARESIPADYTQLSDDVTSLKSAFEQLNDNVITESAGPAPIVSIADGADGMPMRKVEVAIEPVQDKHGYDYPWPAGGGNNLFDEVWESGTINGTTGEEVSNPAFSRSVNFIAVLSNTDYYVYGSEITSTSEVFAFSYQDDGTYISYQKLSSNGTYTTPSNCAKIRLQVRRTIETVTNYLYAVNYPNTVTTYSPYSNVCPITGWTGAKVTRTGKNLWGGEAMKNALLTIRNASIGSDADGGYVSFSALNTANNQLFTSFKPDTQYTVVVRYKKNNTSTHSNIRIIYTDGTKQNFIASGEYEEGKLYTAITTSQVGKTISYIESYYGSGTTSVYYDQCGLFEGVLTEDQFESYQGQTYEVTFPTEAGTVYGGTLDVVSGKLTIDKALYNMTGRTYAASQTKPGRYYTQYMSSNAFDALNLCSHYPVSANMSTDGACYKSGLQIGFNTSFATLQDWNDYLSSQSSLGTPVTCAVTLRNIVEVTITGQDLETLLGVNNVWADAGNTAITYPADTKTYIDNRINSTRKLIAGIETGFVASKAYAVGDMLIIGDDLYKTASSIASGATITVGTNVTKTTVAEQLIALANA